MQFRKGTRKTIYAWAFYDWANSAYALVISTAIFPIYYESVTNGENTVRFLGADFHNTTLYTYSLSLSFLIIAFLSPILSGIADYMGNKKRFMQFFCYLGSFSVISLYFFTGVETLWIGLLFTILASIGFWGSLVFYNAFLPEVAFPKQQDRVSALGFMLGYFGSVFLLLFNLTMVLNPQWYEITDPTLPSRISFLSVGIWWFIFSQYTFSVLPNNIYKSKKPRKDIFFNGFKALKKVYNELAFYPQLRKFLISFFLYSIGVQTTILLSTVYGKKELGLATSNLIITILLVQIVGIVGAFLFSRISERFGNLLALKLTVVIWMMASFGAFLLEKNDPNVYTKFYILGGVLGLVLGAIQSLSRSTYSKLLPEETQNHATYFSFFDVTEKISIVFGTFIFGLAIALTNSMKISILVLSIFFLSGFLVLQFMKKTKYVQ